MMKKQVLTQQKEDSDPSDDDDEKKNKKAVKEGYLLKRKRYRKQWTKVYGVLTATKLSIYDDEE